MKIKLKIEKDYDVRILRCDIGARYWEDAEVNGVADVDGDLIPFRDGDYWKINIDVEAGRIIGWPQGTVARVHYKVCDDGFYTLVDNNGSNIVTKEGYVPDMLCPSRDGYGDYVIMNIDENGLIEDWEFDVRYFSEEED